MKVSKVIKFPDGYFKIFLEVNPTQSISFYCNAYYGRDFERIPPKQKIVQKFVVVVKNLGLKKVGGRARAGSKRSPLFVGGGVIFGPTTKKNYHQKVNKKQKKLALNRRIGGFGYKRKDICCRFYSH